MFTRSSFSAEKEIRERVRIVAAGRPLGRGEHVTKRRLFHRIVSAATTSRATCTVNTVTLVSSASSLPPSRMVAIGGTPLVSAILPPKRGIANSVAKNAAYIATASPTASHSFAGEPALQISHDAISPTPQ